MTVRAAVLVLMTALAHAACSGGSSGHFSCSDSPPATDVVALRCGPEIADDALTIEVVIGVPTTATDIYSFSFYVEYDPAFLIFEPGSAVAGNLLIQDGAAHFEEARLLDGEPGLITVGASRTDTSTGVPGVPGKDLIVSFVMRAVPGARFEASMPKFLDGRVSNSDRNPIPEITFNDQLLLSAR